jgi:hypothetical protein
MAQRQAKPPTSKILSTPTDDIGRQSCYDCGAPLGWDMTQERLFCTGDRRHKQNLPHPDFRP